MDDDLLLCDVLLTLTGVGPLDMAKARLWPGHSGHPIPGVQQHHEYRDSVPTNVHNPGRRWPGLVTISWPTLFPVT